MYTLANNSSIISNLLDGFAYNLWMDLYTHTLYILTFKMQVRTWQFRTLSLELISIFRPTNKTATSAGDYMVHHGAPCFFFPSIFIYFTFAFIAQWMKPELNLFFSSATIWHPNIALDEHHPFDSNFTTLQHAASELDHKLVTMQRSTAYIMQLCPSVLVLNTVLLRLKSIHPCGRFFTATTGGVWIFKFTYLLCDF